MLYSPVLSSPNYLQMDNSTCVLGNELEYLTHIPLSGLDIKLIGLHSTLGSLHITWSGLHVTLNGLYTRYKMVAHMIMMMMMADSSQRRIWGRLMVSSCMLVVGCRVRLLLRRLYCTFYRQWFRMRMIGMLLALSASCDFPSRLHASLPRTYDWGTPTVSVWGLLLPWLMLNAWLGRLNTSHSRQ